MAGRADREGISILELARMFPDERAAQKWFEEQFWPDGRRCPRCGSERTSGTTHKTMPYWCTECRRYFSVRTGTLLESSRLPLLKWVYAIYLELTALKVVSSLKLARDIDVSQPAAWFMLHRIRAAFRSDDEPPFQGPFVEFDETYVGGKERNKHARDRLGHQAMTAKTVVAAARDRATGHVSARVLRNTDRATMHWFVREHVTAGATICTDAHAGYQGIPGIAEHIVVNHERGEYVTDQGTTTNGVESFWSMLKRGIVGTYQQISRKHLQLYVDAFAGRHNLRDLDTADQMAHVAAGLAGKRLTYKQLIGDGLAAPTLNAGPALL